MTTLKNQITDVLKATMRAKEMGKLTVIRGLQAAIKQIEVDERIELDDICYNNKRDICSSNN